MTVYILCIEVLHMDDICVKHSLWWLPRSLSIEVISVTSCNIAKRSRALNAIPAGTARKTGNMLDKSTQPSITLHMHVKKKNSSLLIQLTLRSHLSLRQDSAH